MQLRLITNHTTPFVEGVPEADFLATAADVDRLIEACFADGARAAVLYAANLPPTFFDLSSGVAGDILQKLRLYRIQLAVVAPPGSVVFSSRFGEMVADEQRGRDFAVFADRMAAVEWLTK
jgi:hypothetical protein